MDTAYNILMNTSSLNLSFWDVALRFLCAMLVGLVIGTEREYTNRPAGMRTHILVAVGACLCSLIGIYLVNKGLDTDPMRIGAQVVSGIGFLGAGIILVQSK